MSKVVKCPKGFEIGEEEWTVLVAEWESNGRKMIGPMRVKEMFWVWFKEREGRKAGKGA